MPHGDLPRARETRRMMLDAGIRIPSYGSYYRVRHEEDMPFEKALESAYESE